jgi:hypothetical protein
MIIFQYRTEYQEKKLPAIKNNKSYFFDEKI